MSKSLAFVRLNIVMKTVNSWVTGLNAKKDNVWYHRTVLRLETGRSSCVEIAHLASWFYFLTCSKNKKSFILFLYILLSTVRCISWNL